MTKIRRAETTSTRAVESKEPSGVKPEFKAKLRKAFDGAMKDGKLAFDRDLPLGVKFTRVTLKAGKGPDAFSYTALIPTGALSPKAKQTDPNKAPYMFIERSGGIAGRSVFAGPLSIPGKKGQAFFDKFLEGQPTKPGGGVAHTMKAPSDNEDGKDGNVNIGVDTKKAPSDAEDGGGGRIGGGGMQTKKAPSDAEDGGGGRIGGGGVMHTMKAPSDAEDGGGGRIGGGTQTKKAPSDAEDGGGGRIGGGGLVQTMKAPSDAEDGGGGRIGGGLGGGTQTKKAPSDAEDGGGGRIGGGGGLVQTMKAPSDNEDGGGGTVGASAVTKKAPSDAEDGGSGSIR